MLIKNTTDRSAPKPIGIGRFVIMPGQEENIPDEVAYVAEFDKYGNKTGKKMILPSVRLMAGLGQISYEETKQPVEKNDKAVAKKAPAVEEAEAVVEEVPAAKPRRTRKKAE